MTFKLSLNPTFKILTFDLILLMKSIFTFLIIGTCISFQAQVTLRITQMPANTPSGSTFYFASSTNNWNPASANHTLSSDGQGAWVITIPEGTGTVQFKFTRGSWASVEGDANGGEIGNRSFTFTGQAQTINLVVLSWKDLGGAGGNSTAASNVQILNPTFYMPQLNRSRRVWLYLPPDYFTTNKNYPVIYMHDGQNLFDNSTSFSGEWQVDETLNNLHQNGDYGAIVVGIDNGGTHRINEYGPWVNSQYGGGQGHLYMDFIVETLKPYIDANFRTLPQAPYTAMIGSSLGALISTYGQVKFATTFSKVGSFSPAYWFNLNELNEFIQNTNQSLAQSRYYFVAGQNESSTMVQNITTIRTALQAKGLTTANTFVKIDSYGTHTEGYWRGEFGAAYQWLFANTNLSTEELAAEEQQLFQISPSQIFAKGIDTAAVFQLVDIAGKKVREMRLSEGVNELPNDLASGIYILRNERVSLRVYL